MISEVVNIWMIVKDFAKDVENFHKDWTATEVVDTLEEIIKHALFNMQICKMKRHQKTGYKANNGSEKN